MSICAAGIALVVGILALSVPALPRNALLPAHDREANDTAVTRTQWKGHAQIPGAVLLSRINLKFVDSLCHKLVTDIAVALKAVKLLSESKLIGTTPNQIRRYSYICLKLENIYTDSINYADSLALCPNQVMNNAWDTYYMFRTNLDTLWAQLRLGGNYGLRNETGGRNSVRSSPVRPELTDKLIIELGYGRPKGSRPAQSPLLIGLGIGALATTLLGSFLGSNDREEIEGLNRNIHKVNTKVQVTNQRIDILAKNVSNSINHVKNILDKLQELSSTRDVHQGILWNFEQLTQDALTTKLSFKLAEHKITLLDAGIINPDLIRLSNIKQILTEGLTVFPNLEAPLMITRLSLSNFIQLVEIEKVGHHQYLMIIPLVTKVKYNIYNLIPHPIKLKLNALVIPDMNDVVLTTNENYIITRSENIQEITTNSYLTKSIEPIYHVFKSTCEWEAFNNNITAMLELCNYRRVGMSNGTFLTETKNHRLVYFTETTPVKLTCPDGQIRDTLQGLHQIPLECDVSTYLVHWPSKQSLKIDVEKLFANETARFDLLPLPIFDLNETVNLHDSLHKLISDLPDKEDLFTFNFAKHDISLERVQSYSIIAQAILAVMVVINSCIIGLLAACYCRNHCRRNYSSSALSSRESFRDARESFRGLRDSIRTKKDSIKNRIKKQKLAGTLKLRDSIRGKTNRAKQHFQDNRPTGLSSLRDSWRDKRGNLRQAFQGRPKLVHIGTNTDHDIIQNHYETTPRSVPNVYPVIPRYV